MCYMMKNGYFIDKETNEIVDKEKLENELPEKFLFVAMEDRQYPKLEYITLLGKIACGDSSLIDRILLDRILDENELYDEVIDFLCVRYRFCKY